MICVGVDGHSKGWVAVALEDGQVHQVDDLSTIAEVADRWPGAAAVGIDIPIGLPVLRDRKVRSCDAEARSILRGRASTIFSAPPREVLECESYAEANKTAQADWGRGITQQAFALRKKIIEVEEWRRTSKLNVVEVHPELSFAAMNEGKPLLLRKKSFGGALRRLELLDGAGIRLLGQELLEPVMAIPVDDVLDAAAVAWSANRIGRGVEQRVPEHGAEPAIRF